MNFTIHSYAANWKSKTKGYLHDDQFHKEFGYKTSAQRFLQKLRADHVYENNSKSESEKLLYQNYLDRMINLSSDSNDFTQHNYQNMHSAALSALDHRIKMAIRKKSNEDANVLMKFKAMIYNAKNFTNQVKLKWDDPDWFTHDQPFWNMTSLSYDEYVKVAHAMIDPLDNKTQYQKLNIWYDMMANDTLQKTTNHNDMEKAFKAYHAQREETEKTTLYWIRQHLPDFTLPGQNYAGPGNDFGRRLMNDLDRISLKHDLSYKYAKSYDDVLAADNLYLDSLHRITDTHGIKVAMANGGIGIKKLVEEHIVSIYPHLPNNLKSKKIPTVTPEGTIEWEDNDKAIAMGRVPPKIDYNPETDRIEIQMVKNDVKEILEFNPKTDRARWKDSKGNLHDAPVDAIYQPHLHEKKVIGFDLDTQTADYDWEIKDEYEKDLEQLAWHNNYKSEDMNNSITVKVNEPDHHMDYEEDKETEEKEKTVTMETDVSINKYVTKF